MLIQKIREIEKVTLFEEYKPREGEIVTGLVHHVAGRDIFVDLGKTEAILPYSEQIRREHYTINQRVRAIIHRVDKENKGLQIILSRASVNFLKGLFEAEVPEIAEKVVEITDVVRDPGFRSKVVVKSNSSKVDPVGACVGIRCSRIRVIMAGSPTEDRPIPTMRNPCTCWLSFSPATVLSVRVIDKASKRALIIVPDDQLAIAIGREGQNIKLVSRLTGWELEVKSEGQKVEEAKKTTDMAVADLLKIDGISAKVADTLVKLGMADIRKIAGFTVPDLCVVEGVGEKTAQKIISGAKKFLEENPGYGEKAAPAAAAKDLETKEVQKNESKETESK